MIKSTKNNLPSILKNKLSTIQSSNMLSDFINFIKKYKNKILYTLVSLSFLIHSDYILAQQNNIDNKPQKNTIQKTTKDKTEKNKQKKDDIKMDIQYVLLAFDGSKSIDMWRNTREFAKYAKEKHNIDIKFTYFISATYFITNKYKNEYIAPNGKKGISEIGFSINAENIKDIINQINLAHSEGHEIASHAAGHFNGSNWTTDMWLHELKEFNKLIFDTSMQILNKENLANDLKLNITKNDIIGFRAPYLGRNESMYKALNQMNFKYDTSCVSNANEIPKKDQNNIWKFCLASIKTNKGSTLSMDYNFYLMDSGAQNDAKNKDIYKKRMYDAYMKYFENNYNSNRAPLHIGHHFSQWNGGAYWEAMKEFALNVCGKKDVKCITYKELVDVMEKMKKEDEKRK